MDITQCLMNWPILNMLEPEFISKISMVVVHGSSGKEVLMVMRDGMVYALGSNKEGCSGTGDTHSSLTPVKVDALCERNIKTFAHGSGSHVLALTHAGQVYSWGNNNQLQLGNTNSRKYSNLTPTLEQVIQNTRVVDIACGKFHSLALTASGEVYQWGRSMDGEDQYGHDYYRTNAATPMKVTFFNHEIIVCISCGDSSSMVVTANGEVYGWGDNNLGQLGIGNYNKQRQPCKVTALTGIAIEKVVCGYMHTLALSKKGILYTWGANTYGQLGHKCNNDTKVCSPVQLKLPLVWKVLDVAATHYNHISVAMGEGKRVFVWGHCLGQCIQIPMLTPHRCIYDALACYATPNVMHKPCELRDTKTKVLSVCMHEAFNNPDTSDLAIQVEGKHINVHKAILKMRCQYFRTMFQKEWAENNQSVIEHKQYSYDVYRAFLEYLYTDEINVPVKDAEEFLDLTNAYYESNLRRRWIQLIKKDVTVCNVIRLYIAAIHFNAKELEIYCFQYALQHMTMVVQTPHFSELDQLTMKSFIIKAANAGAFKT